MVDRCATIIGPALIQEEPEVVGWTAQQYIDQLALEVVEEAAAAAATAADLAQATENPLAGTTMPQAASPKPLMA